MDIAERLFHWAWTALKGDAPKNAGVCLPTAHLDHLAHLLAGKPLRCFRVLDHHLSAVEGHIFLPKQWDPKLIQELGMNDGTLLDMGRVAGQALFTRLGWYIDGLPSEDASARLQAFMETELPNLTPLMRRLAEVIGPQRSWNLVFGAPPQRANHKTSAEFLPREQGETLPSAPKPINLNTRPPTHTDELDDVEPSPLQHNFEKTMTADEYGGGNKPKDGRDDDATTSHVLDELEVDRVIRSNMPCQTYNAEGLAIPLSQTVAAGAPDSELSVSTYPEWFAGEQRYREAWCRVLERVGKTAPSDNHKASPAAANLLRHAPRWQNRLFDGQEIDLQAALDQSAQRLAGEGGVERIYANKVTRDCDLALILLVDRSLSTDTWTAGSHVLSTFKKALIHVGHQLAFTETNLLVAAFSSDTRHKCDWTWLMAEDERWAVAEPRIRALEPEGYTRIGPALRHAGRKLCDRRERRRAIILISDGRPTDHDHYEGQHGIHDVRRAVLELERNGIAFRSLAMSRKDAALHQRMFPPGTTAYATPSSIGHELLRIILACTTKR